MLSNEVIKALESKGFNRWTKGVADRLYIRPTYLGLELDFYKTGNIRSASINGKDISNTRGRAMREAKCYIDIKTGRCVSYYDEFVEAMQELLSEVMQ